MDYYSNIFKKKLKQLCESFAVFWFLFTFNQRETLIYT